MMYYLQINSMITIAILMVLYTQTNSEMPTTCSVIQGLPGLNGRDGRDGSHGHKGEPGPRGETGNPGIRGIAGPPGKVGPKGDQGNTGSPGLQGSKGEKGQKGDPDARMAEKQLILEDKIAALEKSLVFLKKSVQYSIKGVKILGDKVYIPTDLEGDYSTSQAACQGLGGTLPTPMNSAENDIILQYVKEFKNNVFLGINDIKEEGVFVYLNGKQITYSNWPSTEPNGKRNENCVEARVNHSAWNDINCANKNRVLCEF
ncbi:Hypothetical predicted protein [Pelobates cultripes]|uniref:C-type lectin domain-containing protein n=1 Tax=Pelobates cultripes TaxID=61616 RepID=A0AAD1T994_PELCU|nr:Hypothetical predicted protein [Pelobates cultripes]